MSCFYSFNRFLMPNPFDPDRFFFCVSTRGYRNESMQALQEDPSFRGFSQTKEGQGRLIVEMSDVREDTTSWQACLEQEKQSRSDQTTSAIQIERGDPARDNYEARSLSNLHGIDSEEISRWSSRRLLETVASEMALQVLPWDRTHGREAEQLQSSFTAPPAVKVPVAPASPAGIPGAAGIPLPSYELTAEREQALWRELQDELIRLAFEPHLTEAQPAFLTNPDFSRAMESAE
jgi:hypothetical protein